MARLMQQVYTYGFRNKCEPYNNNGEKMVISGPKILTTKPKCIGQIHAYA